MIWQYIIIGIIFIIALYYVYKRVIVPFNDNEVGCSKGCGCKSTITPTEKKT